MAPVRLVKGPRVHEVQTLHEGPSHTEQLLVSHTHTQTVTQRQWACPASPGELQQRVLAVLLLWVGGLAVVLVEVGRHVGWWVRLVSAGEEEP